EIMNKSSMEYVTIELCNKISIKIINIYIPPTTDMDKKAYEILFTGNNTVIVGDLNAHNPLWNHTQTNKRGKIIEDLMEENNFAILNTGQPTHQNYYGGMNVLDLSIVSRQLATKCHWYVHNDTLGSDHFPTFTS